MTEVHERIRNWLFRSAVAESFASVTGNGTATPHTQNGPQNNPRTKINPICESPGAAAGDNGGRPLYHSQSVRRLSAGTRTRRGRMKFTNRVVCRRRDELEILYQRYNQPALIHPDPLELLYEYPAQADREVVGLLAAGLAYGRVAQILRSARCLLGRLGPVPSAFLAEVSITRLQEAVGSFKHRWTTGQEAVALLMGIGGCIKRHGSLRQGFVNHLRTGCDDVQQALDEFVAELRDESGLTRNSLLPTGGACKRMHLFLRWMVRRDRVDPGGWQEVSPALLIVPLDTHMHRMALAMGLTQRRQADLKTAREITQGFRAICPEDPVRYDFALTRFGIRPDMDEASLLQRCRSMASRGS